MEENRELVEQTCDCGEDCQCQEGEIADIFVEIESNKELDRLERLYLFNDETKQTLSEDDNYMEGVYEALELAGFYNTLVSFGLPEDKVFELTINKQTIDHNLVSAEMANKTSVDVAKAQSVQIEKTSL